MISYKKCSEVEFEKVYQGFTMGFSDYFIKIELSQEQFQKHFFEVEGNNLNYSFIALEDNKPIGVILGGIKDYEGIRTIRCGGLCVIPDYRGKNISTELFLLHKQTALVNDCRQLFLEVLAENERAIKFYQKIGYDKVYDLSYFSLSHVGNINITNNNLDINKLEYEDIIKLSDKMEDIHINWQNGLDYMNKVDGITHYGAYFNSELAGILCINTKGRIFSLYTLPEHRKKGIAKSLLANAVKDMGLKSINISFPNNSKLEGFVKHNNFQKDKVAQYEMYLTL